MAPRMETITEEFCGWPYFQQHTFTQKLPRKPRTKKVATLGPTKTRKPRKAKAA